LERSSGSLFPRCINIPESLTKRCTGRQLRYASLPPVSFAVIFKIDMLSVNKIILTCIIVLVVGCDSRPQIRLTTEQAVYESFFLFVVGDAYSKVYLANASENRWFIENPFNEQEWNRSLSDMGGINIQLVKRLYEVNEMSTALGWQPFITNVEMLPVEYANLTHKEGEHCFDRNGHGNVNIYSKDGRAFRSYYSISKPAFSEDGEYALIKYSIHCAPLSGAGEGFAVFQFKQQRWQLIGGRRIWVS